MSSERSLTLYLDGYFVNQWDGTCMIALEEKQLAYSTARALLRNGSNIPPSLVERAHISRVPAFQHGDLWLTESSAIVEYLDDAFPDRPRLFPADPAARARARQTMAFVRSDMWTLRNERSWWTCVYPHPPPAPLSQQAERDARELVDLVVRLHRAGELAEWNISHADLALTLLRLARNDHELPAAAQQFLDTSLVRPSIKSYVEHSRPPNPPPNVHSAG